MSIFASRTIKTIAIPFDVPHTVTIQKLAGRHIQKAREADQQASIRTLKRFGKDFREQLSVVGGGDDKAVEEAIAKQQADPLHGYDRYVVLAKGIKAWSYDEPLTPEPVLDEDGTTVHRIPAIEDLSEEAADFLAREILALTLPPRDEAARKNVSGSSSAD